MRGNSTSAGGILGLPPLANPLLVLLVTPMGPRWITPQEACDRKAKGLYYYCDEKFTLGHWCERPQLFMMEDNNDSASENEIANGISEISFHAIASTDHP